jgi:hypothetical protein
MSKEETREFDECGRAVALRRNLLAKYAPPKAPEMTVLSVDYQEPPPANALYAVEPGTPEYVEQIQECCPGTPEFAQDFQEGV